MFGKQWSPLVPVISSTDLQSEQPEIAGGLFQYMWRKGYGYYKHGFFVARDWPHVRWTSFVVLLHMARGIVMLYIPVIAGGLVVQYFGSSLQPIVFYQEIVFPIRSVVASQGVSKEQLNSYRD